MPALTADRPEYLSEKLVSAILVTIEKVEERERPVVRSSRGLVKKILIHVGGIGLIFLGVVGLFLPFLQGIFLIIAGIGLLSTGNQGVRKWVKELGKKYPKPASVFKTIKKKIVTLCRSRSNPGNGGSEEEPENDR
jgi:hypothetical protein